VQFTYLCHIGSRPQDDHGDTSMFSWCWTGHWNISWRLGHRFSRPRFGARRHNLWNRICEPLSVAFVILLPIASSARRPKPWQPRQRAGHGNFSPATVRSFAGIPSPSENLDRTRKLLCVSKPLIFSEYRIRESCSDPLDWSKDEDVPSQALRQLRCRYGRCVRVLRITRDLEGETEPMPLEASQERPYNRGRFRCGH
jgi:hypothetical protein